MSFCALVLIQVLSKFYQNFRSLCRPSLVSLPNSPTRPSGSGLAQRCKLMKYYYRNISKPLNIMLALLYNHYISQPPWHSNTPRKKKSVTALAQMLKRLFRSLSSRDRHCCLLQLKLVRDDNCLFPKVRGDIFFEGPWQKSTSSWDTAVLGFVFCSTNIVVRTLDLPITTSQCWKSHKSSTWGGRHEP